MGDSSLDTMPVSDPAMDYINSALDRLEASSPDKNRYPARQPTAELGAEAEQDQAVDTPVVEVPSATSCVPEQVVTLLEARSAQNEALATMVPAYLESMADSIAEVEPRLNIPAKRKKWAAKVTAKILDRLAVVTSMADCEGKDEEALAALTAHETHNRKQVHAAMHRMEGDADIMRVMYSLEACKGSAYRARCAEEGIVVPDTEPTDLITKVGQNLKQWYAQVTSEDRWRYSYFRDNARTKAYEKAITAAAVGKRVIDIGVGSGLLPMLAASVAADVITIETSKTAFAAVEKTIAANDLQGKVRVAKDMKAALAMVADDDLPIVVTFEVLAAVPLVEELKDALALRSALGDRCVQMIPESAELVVVPTNIPPQRVLLECPLLHEVTGFDLSLFNEFRLHKPMPHQLGHLEHTMLAVPEKVLAVDLSNPETEFHQAVFECETGGEWNSVVAWYELQLDEDTRVSTSPENADSLQAIQYLPGPFNVVEAGAKISFGVAHNGAQYAFKFEKNGTACDIDGAPLLRWHWGMVNDEYRNGLYNEAIQAAMAKISAKKEKPLVLDIGTGSGLLSMMCCRAGAKEVVAVDMVEALAVKSREIIKANGYDCVTVYNKMSSGLEIGVEMDRPADLLVSEIVDVALLGEHMVPAVTDAQKRGLLADDVVMIPKAATLIGCLINVPAQPGVPGEAEAAHNLKLQTEVAVPGTEMYQQMLLNRLEHTRLSAPFDVFSVDFYKSSECNEGMDEILKIECTQDGVLDAVGLWFSMDLDDERTISTAPGSVDGGDTCWQQALYWLQGEVADRTFKKGDMIPIRAKHDGVKTRLSLA